MTDKFKEEAFTILEKINQGLDDLILELKTLRKDNKKLKEELEQYKHGNRIYNKI